MPPMSQLDAAQVIKSAYDDAANAIRVEVTSGAGTSTAINDGTDPTIKAAVNPDGSLVVDASGHTVPVTGSGTFTVVQPTGSSLHVDVDSSALPTGAATSANQATEIASLSSIDSKTPSLGQALSAASVPVVLPATQITALTPPTTVTVTQATGTNLHAVIDSSALPSGAATSALQSTISGQLPSTLGAHITSASLAVNIASDQTVPVSAASLPLPSGASTSVLQTTGNTSLSSIDGKVPSGLTVSSTRLLVDASGTTQPVSGTVTVTQATGTNLHTVVDSSALPTGASTSAKQPALGTAGTASSDVITVQGIASMTALKVDGSAVTQPVSAASLPLPTGAATAVKQPALGTAGSPSIDVITVQGRLSMTPILIDGSATLQPVTGTVTVVQNTGTSLHAVIDSGTVAATQSGTWTVSESGYTNSEFARLDYTGTNVTTAAYQQLIASTANAYQEIEIFDSSGQTLELAFGGSGSEVNKFLIYPGGNGRIRRNVPSGTRISIKAVSATASVGEIDINFYG